MENVAIIKNLGLDDQEANIYLALLRLGGLKASTIAKEVGLKRTTIYPILQSMAQRGLVNVFYRKSERMYYAEKPTKVVAVMQKKLDLFENIIPVLGVMQKNTGGQIGLQFIETLPELKNFYLKILDEYKNKSYRVIGSATGWEGLDPKWFIQFRTDRGQNNIHTRLLLTEESKNINPKNKKLLREFKYLPEKYQFKSTIDIYDDKILIVSPQLSSLAVVVAVPAMVDIFKSVFDIIWEMLSEEMSNY